MHIAIRVDASDQIGTGHVMRCLTLADALRQRGASLRFVSRHMPAHLQEMISSRGHHFVLLEDIRTKSFDELPHARWLGVSQSDDAKATLQELADQVWDWIIVDHYALDSRWEMVLRKITGKILVIDDLADRMHDCDVLVDQNLYSDMLDRYESKVGTLCRVLAGPRYALLRPDFSEMKLRCKVRSGDVKRILVFFGGIDAQNYTSLAIAALSGLHGRAFQVDVVIGAGHSQREQLLNDCAVHGYACHVQTDRMADLIATADLAIGAGGATTWERCCLGLPTLSICMADNQRRQIADAATAGLLYAFKESEDIQDSIKTHLSALIDNPMLRSMLSSNGMAVIDGNGVSRVVAALGGNSIGMRKATAEDSRNLYEWRNHPAIRAVSRHGGLIDWEGHQKWLAAVLADANRILLIGAIARVPVGVVRYDCRDNEAEVSIYLVPEKLSSGFGSELLQAAEQWLQKNHPEIRSISAHILGNNPRSKRLFANADYAEVVSCFTKRLKHDE